MVEALGYETDSKELTLPAIFQGLETGDLDLFVEAWLPPACRAIWSRLSRGPWSPSRSIWTRPLTASRSQAGLGGGCQVSRRPGRDKQQFNGEIYGIEPGNDGNKLIQDMIDNDTYGLGDWELVESSTSGMLAEIERHVNNDESGSCSPGGSRTG